MIYVIHDENRTDRKELFTKELAAQGVKDYKIQPAIKSSRPSRGIALAHISCVLDAKKNGYDSIIILEDDVKFTKPTALQDWLQNAIYLPNDFDIYLGGIYSHKRWFDFCSVAKVEDACGFHCYMITKRSYDKFILCPTDKHIDRWATKNFNCYVSKPFYAIQHNTKSDNGSNKSDYSYLLKKYSSFLNV